jgi:3-hydroxyacyl-[acyl-carrier-protein] dehydratase
VETLHVVKEGTIRFDPSDGIYTDHFPGYPVVPGSLIIQAFLDLAGSVCEIESFQFRSFVIPGSYAYRMERRADRWECLLMQGDGMMVRGKLKT